MKEKNKIRLTESQLNGVIKESLKTILKESNMSPKQAAYELYELSGVLYNELQNNGNSSVTLSEDDVYRLDNIGTVLGEYFGIM